MSEHKPIELTMGVALPSPTTEETVLREGELRATISHYIPDFAKAVEEAARKGEKEKMILLHQDSFAAGYDKDEYTLLGMAIKFAGLYGVNINIIGLNHSTF